MKSKNNLLIIFAKRPIKGLVKTRLAASIGDDFALEIYRKLLCQTILVSQSKHWNTIIFWDAEPTEICLEYNLKCKAWRVQVGADLGERMNNAFKDSFESGVDNVVIIGSDIAEIKTSYIEDAFQKLYENQVVIGPADDGGYWLIGQAKFYPQIFSGIRWSSEYVYTDTVKIIDNLGVAYSTIKTLCDIDTLSDLESRLPEWKHSEN